jgi:hypothetical protein
VATAASSFRTVRGISRTAGGAVGGYFGGAVGGHFGGAVGGHIYTSGTNGAVGMEAAFSNQTKLPCRMCLNNEARAIGGGIACLFRATVIADTSQCLH